MLCRAAIILKLFDDGGVLGGMVGGGLRSSISFSTFAEWWRISSPLVGFGSGSSCSMPVRADFFAGLRAFAGGACNRGFLPSLVSLGVSWRLFIVQDAPWRGLWC